MTAAELRAWMAAEIEPMLLESCAQQARLLGRSASHGEAMFAAGHSDALRRVEAKLYRLVAEIIIVDERAVAEAHL